MVVVVLVIEVFLRVVVTVMQVFIGGCSCGDGRVHRRWYGGSLHRRRRWW